MLYTNAIHVDHAILLYGSRGAAYAYNFCAPAFAGCPVLELHQGSTLAPPTAHAPRMHRGSAVEP